MMKIAVPLLSCYGTASCMTFRRWDERMDRANKRPTRIRRRVLEAETGSGLDVRRLPGLAATDARPY